MSRNSSKKDYSDAVVSLFRTKTELRQFAQSERSVKLASSFDKTLCWCVGLFEVFAENQARIHLAGVRSEVVNVLALVPFHFYRQSLICLRIILDEVLAFSYFESHPKEFKTLLRDPDFYVSKKSIYEFHKFHSWHNTNAERLCVWSRIESQYRELSRIIHAQTPGHISIATSFQSFEYCEDKMDTVLEMAQKNDEAVSIFFASLYQDEFSEFRPELKKSIVRTWRRKFTADLGLRP